VSEGVANPKDLTGWIFVVKLNYKPYKLKDFVYEDVTLETRGLRYEINLNMPYTIQNLINDFQDYGLNPNSFVVNENNLLIPCVSDSNYQFRLTGKVTEKVILISTEKLIGSVETGYLPFYLQVLDTCNGVKLFINPNEKLNRDNNWILEIGFEIFPETYSQNDLFLRLDLLFHNIDKIITAALDDEIVSINVLANNPNACTAEQV
jgi:hypothetical protein